MQICIQKEREATEYENVDMLDWGEPEGKEVW